jgi:hypothetical protein
MSKNTIKASNNNADTNNNSTSLSYNTNNQDFNESVNRALDQTKDNINRSIEESKKQIPQYNNIANSYQEQTLQAAREITEHFIESQKTIIKSIQSAWAPYQQNFNNKVNSCMSPEAATNAYSRFISNVADNTISALRNTNNLVFASLDAYKTTVQHAKDTTKQIFDINTKAAQTFEHNSREVARTTQDANTRFNASIGSGNGSNTSGTTATTTTTTSTTSAA